MHPILFLLPAVLIAGQAGSQAQPELEWRGQYQGDASTRAIVVMNAKHWERIWRGLDKPAPPLDFTRYCAVVAYAGERPTGGYTLEFLAPVAQGDDLLIKWRVVAPAPDSYTTQALAQPWKAKAFPRPKGKVIVEQMSHE